MTTITKYVVLLILCLSATQINAQEVVKDSLKTKNSFQIKVLKNLKETIKNEEREFLKTEIEAINQRLEKGEISESEANVIKKELAKKRALNIENRIAIIDNKIALLERNDYSYDPDSNTNSTFGLSFSNEDGESWNLLSIKKKNKPRVYDRRTSSDLVFAIGWNHTLSDGKTIGDDYYAFTSGFVELGWAWKSRLLKESNAIRLKYGFSFQWNKLSPKDDKYFVQNGGTTTLEAFPSDLRESEFRVTNLVFPVHFEFGPSKKIERDTYFRYSTHKKFKIGVGGYAGFRIGTQQKLRFKENGDRVKQKIRRNYNASDFVYGLSAYVGRGNTSLYFKYDLNPLFQDQAIDQNNISLGVRFDFD
ncbi:hypothetical protein RM697_10315 [Ichthyenterobacterium sp. W332]|uniref:Outer membrane protein beta-barrel domain-containing protein n=1 Tax=Microcosmobacter mediterraneus TaxID=3075607 RepID=A0ABU2YLM1_9FLAO|nr:hypothetical protein [Ichthyenterobacterium sp. W332]MDT0559044.1 hypothetical protein [Ichthyenterobacterium sp. W332]